MAKFLIDTNFLIYCIKKHVLLDDLFQVSAAADKIVIPSNVIDELISTAHGDLAIVQIARLLLQGKKLKGLVNCKYTVLKASGKVDDFLILLAQPGDYVCTHDKELSRKVKQKAASIGIINISGKRMIVK